MQQELKKHFVFCLEEYDHAKHFQNDIFPWDALKSLKEYILSYQNLGTIEVDIPSSAHLENEHLITIKKGSVIESGAFIKGPCIIGHNCSIRKSAYIRGNVITGDNCVIGHGTEIKNSIMLNNACAAHFSYVGDSIIGNRVNLGAGTVLSNLRLDKKEIVIFINGMKIKTNLTKLGAIISDDVQIGCNTVLNPGTCINENSFIYANMNIGGYIPSYSVVKPKEKPIIRKRKMRNGFK
jgi:UDP-N-acetylglucosamine diphosphorylase / glucose-1-phosphate thymidylyltransferase / UDP-N-acetylgalactosamine diphosphorylase / glucosamine-1-phosphate N-acetyltransferase / galactosamine-1-phosphate N-acetyltransferase